MATDIKTLKKPIAIIGMGKSGEAAKRLLLASGVSSQDFFTFDQKHAGANYQDASTLISEVNPQTLIVSPGVPLSLEWIQKALDRGVTVTSELSLACSVLKKEKLIGVTGSVGKSTTVSILGAGLEGFSKSFFVGGNLGTPFADYAADVLLNERVRADWIVLELSSYQLENCVGLQLDYSAITFLTPNHMERYPSLLDYYETKWKILSLTKLRLILNSKGGDLSSYSASLPDSKILFADRDNFEFEKFHLPSAKLIGSHNQDNLALAVALAMQAGWPETSVEAMKQFRGLSHRLEYVADVHGIRFINDSKATAMDSVVIAVEAAASHRSEAGKLFVLLGGRDKNLPWEKLEALQLTPRCDFIFFGECRDIAQKKSKLPGKSFLSLKEAMPYCIQSAKSQDTVLLSPGGTSLDEFKSFEARGNYFKDCVQLFAKA